MRESNDCEVLEKGTRKVNRTGIDTLSTFNINYEIDMAEGFPLLTTKEISWKNIVVENLWFLSGDTHIGILKKHGCKFWDPWADDDGKVPSAYGNFWRHFPVHIDGRPEFLDQVGWVVEQLKTNPMSRRMLISAWAPGNAHTSALPPCHALWMVNVQLDESGEPMLCLHLTQRSADVALGVPYNIAGYAFLLHMLSHFSGIKPGIFAHTLVDAHVYTSKPDGSQAEYDHVPGLQDMSFWKNSSLAVTNLIHLFRSKWRCERTDTRDELMSPSEFKVPAHIPADDDARFRGAFVAMNQAQIIGVNGDLPWHYSEDLKRFKRMTLGSTIIMGRLTWESIGARPLPGRRNMVITRQDLQDVECFRSAADAAAATDQPVWFIGGGQLYASALELCHVLDVTWVPDRVDDSTAVRFPDIDTTLWTPGPRTPMSEDTRLQNQRFYRVDPLT